MRITLLSDKNEKPFTCSSCQKTIPSPSCAIEGAPAILGCSPNPSIEQDKFLDFLIYVCPFCGLIQTDAMLDSESYEIVHSHAVGGVWAEHGDKLLEFVSECRGNKPGKLENALEIGPSVSPILKKLTQNVANIQYVDLMNEAPFELTPNEHYKKQPFPSAQLKGEFDLIVGSHVLEHSESIYDFMKAIKRYLKPNGFAILSIPNFHDWLTKKYWNAITSEHLNYPFVEHIRDLCVRLGLNVEFAYFKAHSIFMRVSYPSIGCDTSKSLLGSPKENVGQILEEWVVEINSKINRYERAVSNATQEVVLTGASHLSQYIYLMSAEIRSRARFVLDNASNKYGKRLYGTELIAQPFDIVKNLKKSTVIIPTSPYIAEMTEQVRSLNPNTIIVS